MFMCKATGTFFLVTISSSNGLATAPVGSSMILSACPFRAPRTRDAVISNGIGRAMANWHFGWFFVVPQQQQCGECVCARRWATNRRKRGKSAAFRWHNNFAFFFFLQMREAAECHRHSRGRKSPFACRCFAAIRGNQCAAGNGHGLLHGQANDTNWPRAEQATVVQQKYLRPMQSQSHAKKKQAAGKCTIMGVCKRRGGREGKGVRKAVPVPTGCIFLGTVSSWKRLAAMEWIGGEWPGKGRICIDVWMGQKQLEKRRSQQLPTIRCKTAAVLLACHLQLAAKQWRE